MYLASQWQLTIILNFQMHAFTHKNSKNVHARIKTVFNIVTANVTNPWLTSLNVEKLQVQLLFRATTDDKAYKKGQTIIEQRKIHEQKKTLRSTMLIRTKQLKMTTQV